MARLRPSRPLAEPHQGARHMHAPVRTRGNSLSALTLGALGVVYGDIGTSPLYAFREALAHTTTGPIGSADIIGVLSLTLWALIGGGARGGGRGRGRGGGGGGGGGRAL